MRSVPFAVVVFSFESSRGARTIRPQEAAIERVFYDFEIA